jgi:signal transduction histidine kinase
LDVLATESLTYARFDRGAPEIDWQPRALESWLHQVASTALQGYGDMELRFTNHLPDPGQAVYLEPRYMARALGNLLQNAAKHTDHHVEIVLEAEEEAGRCCIHVDDDGEGIPPADRERVSQPFTRLDSSRNRSSNGHGLGLAIVRRVVDWHGGSVQVSEAPLGGARLTRGRAPHGHGPHPLG